MLGLRCEWNVIAERVRSADPSTVKSPEQARMGGHRAHMSSYIFQVDLTLFNSMIRPKTFLVLSAQFNRTRLTNATMQGRLRKYSHNVLLE